MTTRLPNHPDDPQAENIARALGKAKRSGDGWVCICPAHADRTPSLNITKKNGKLLWHCHAKCSQEAVRSALAAAGVLPASEWGELSFEERITRTYDYRNYQVARFHSPKDFRHFHLDEAGRRVWKMTRADGTKIELRLYRQDELAADMMTRRRKDKPKKCLILEGEKDADAAREIGLPATTNSAGAKKWRHHHSALLQEAGVEEIVIIPDNDETGRTHAGQVARESLALGIGVRVCLLPVEEKGDLSDYLAAPDHDLHTLIPLLKKAPKWEPPLEEPVWEEAASEEETKLRRVAYSSLKRERIEWLIPNTLPAGELTILAGDVGDGKSTLTLALIAAFTTGGRLPDKSRLPPFEVIGFYGEDSETKTILPKLELLGADLSRVFTLDRGHRDRPFQPAQDIPRLLVLLKKCPDVQVVVIDPILDVAAKAQDEYRAGDIRSALAPLQRLIRVTGVAVVGIHHFGKEKKGRKAHQRILGSQAWGAVPRMVLSTAYNHEKKSGVLVRVKSNYGPLDGGYSYQIKGGILDGTEYGIVTIGDAIKGSPEKLLRVDEADPEERSALEEGRSIILGTLRHNEWTDAKDLEKELISHVSKATYTRARIGLRDDGLIERRKETFGPGGKWRWRRTPEPETGSTSEDSHPPRKNPLRSSNPPTDENLRENHSKLIINKGLSARALNEESITYREPIKESQSIGNLRFFDEILWEPDREDEAFPERKPAVQEAPAEPFPQEPSKTDVQEVLSFVKHLPFYLDKNPNAAALAREIYDQVAKGERKVSEAKKLFLEAAANSRIPAFPRKLRAWIDGLPLEPLSLFKSWSKIGQPEPVATIALRYLSEIISHFLSEVAIGYPRSRRDESIRALVASLEVGIDQRNRLKPDGEPVFLGLISTPAGPGAHQRHGEETSARIMGMSEGEEREKLLAWHYSFPRLKDRIAEACGNGNKRVH